MLRLDENFEGQTLGDRGYWYTSDLDFEEVSIKAKAGYFTKGKDKLKVFQTKYETTWYYHDIYNPKEINQTVYLLSPSNLSDYVKVFLEDELIADLRYSEILNDRIVPITFPPKATQRIFIAKKGRFSSSTLWTLWQSESAAKVKTAESTKKLYVLLSIYGMSIVFNTLLLFAYRKKVYFYYLCYLVSIGFSAAWTHAIVPYYWLNHLGFLGIISTSIFVCLFANQFLGLKKNLKIGSNVLTLLVFLQIIGGLVFFFRPIETYQLMQYSMIVSSSVIFVLGVLRFIQKPSAHKLIFNIAFGVYLFAVIYFFLSLLDILPFVSNSITYYGACVETVLMLIAIGYSIWEKEQDRLRKQRDLEHQYKQLSKVFFPHQIRLIQQGHSLEDTMPTGSREACVLAFDVIESSNIRDENFLEYFEDFMAFARTLMMEGYDPDKLISRAYMVKEMGDGFICTIGFPFKSTETNSSEGVVGIADILMKEFETRVASRISTQQVNCCVGIAQGEVRAYFSKSGSIRHDLWGHALVKAIRYESTRKGLFHRLQLPTQSLQIIEKSLFDQLSPSKKDDYRVIDLNRYGLSVRNDPTATELAVKGMSFPLDAESTLSQTKTSGL